MIRTKIKEAIKKRGVFQNEVARKCKVDNSNLSRFLLGKISISTNKIERIFNFLEIELIIKEY